MTLSQPPVERGRINWLLGLGLLVAGAGLGYAFSGGTSAAKAEAVTGYSFSAPPSTEANRIYGVNRRTGEMSVCQFERPEGSTVGITRCFPKGEGAGAQADGDYALAPTHYAGETGIFRVNRATGEMSICYVRELNGANGARDTLLLCTPPAK
ncbi:hypothetical protein ACT6QG_00155 [Xanthobacter sp. TB0136]|uniref:hypothetical protein n=1 Tax=Xanthobacter sp. TB0136 TaxID=3459177 RepID=UPI004039189D